MFLFVFNQTSKVLCFSGDAVSSEVNYEDSQLLAFHFHIPDYLCGEFLIFLPSFDLFCFDILVCCFDIFLSILVLLFKT